MINRELLSKHRNAVAVQDLESSCIQSVLFFKNLNPHRLVSRKTFWNFPVLAEKSVGHTTHGNIRSQSQNEYNCDGTISSCSG